jgi:hypothetical protein
LLGLALFTPAASVGVEARAVSPNSTSGCPISTARPRLVASLRANARADAAHASENAAGCGPNICCP